MDSFLGKGGRLVRAWDDGWIDVGACGCVRHFAFWCVLRLGAMGVCVRLFTE